MTSRKTLIAAAALAVLSAGGTLSANAAPWDHRGDHPGARFEHRGPAPMMHRHYVDRIRINETLRIHDYRVIGDPYFVRGHYVVRTHNRFGHVVFVQVDPYSGAFLGEIRL